MADDAKKQIGETISDSETFIFKKALSERGGTRPLPEFSLNERYELIEEVGRGGMGTVHRAHDKELDREVALKRLLAKFNPSLPHTNPADSNMVFERFLREAKVTAQLDHPNIIPVYEIAKRESGEIFYTMKFVRGINLSKELDKINEDESLDDAAKLKARLRLVDVFVDCCHAISYAHAKGVLHRDLKPENVMIGRYGVTLVVDWGLAKVKGEDDLIPESAFETGFIQMQSGDESLTQAGSIFGTPAYLAPEQARGDHSLVGECSDIFSLGAILYEIISGETAVRGKTMREVLFNAAMADYKDLAVVCPAAPPELVAIVNRALEKDPQDRWKSAQEMADEVEVWRDGGRVSIYQYSSMQLLKRFVSKHRGQLIAAVLVVLVAAGFLGFNSWQSQAQFQDALEARQVELRDLKETISSRKVEDSFARAEVAISVLESAQAEYNPANAVPESSLLAGQSDVDASAMLRDSAQIDELVLLASLPVEEEFVELLPQPERKALARQSVELRLAAAKLKALQGAWEFADEIILATHTNQEEIDSHLAFVEAQRQKLQSMRKARIAFVLDDLRQGLARADRGLDAPLIEDYVFEVVGYRDQQTIELLQAELAIHVAKIRAHQEVRMALPENIERTAKLREEAKKGSSALGDEWDAERFRASIRFTPCVWTQEERNLITLAARVLGNLGMGAAAAEALSPIMATIGDHELALEVANGVANTRCLEAWKPLFNAMGRFRVNSGTSRSIQQLFPRLPNPSEMVIEGRMTYAMRAQLRASRRDYEGAIQDYEKSLKSERVRKSQEAQSGIWGAIGSARHSLKDNAGAIEAFNQAIELSKDQGIALSNRANVYATQNDYQRALEDLNAALALDPDMALAYANRGRYHWALGDIDSGIKDLTKAISLDRDFANAFQIRGQLYFAKGETFKAAQDLTKAINLDERSSGTYYYRGQVREARGEYEGAYEDFSRAIELSPDSPAAFAARAFIRYRRSDFAAGLEDANAALSLQPKHGYALNVRSSIYSAMGAYNEALADVALIIEDDPGNARAYSLRADIYNRTGQLGPALADANKAIQLDKDYGFAYTARASIRVELKEYQAAGKDCREALRLSPKDSRAQALLGLIYSREKKWAEAEAEFTKAIELGGFLASPYANRATCRLNLKKFQEALEDAEKALELWPQAYYAQNTITNVYHALENYPEALISAEKSIKMKATAKAFVNLANLKKAMKDREGAIAAYSKAIEAEPKAALGYYGRAVLLGSSREFDKAIADIDRALEVVSKEDMKLSLLSSRAGFKAQSGDFNGALADYQAIIELDPKSPLGYSGRAAYKMSKQDYLGAIEDATLALQIDPKHAVSWYRRGWAKFELRNYPEAERDLQESLKHNAEDARSHCALGIVTGAMGNPRGALVHFDRAIEIDPSDSWFHASKGYVCLRLAELEDAIESYTKAIELGSKDPRHFYYRANSRQRTNDYLGAIEDCEQALKLKPDPTFKAAIEQHINASKNSIKWTPWLTKECKTTGDKLKRIQAYFWHSNLAYDHPNVVIARRELEVMAKEIEPKKLNAEERADWVALCLRGGYMYTPAGEYVKGAYYFEQASLASESDTDKGNHAYNAACDAALHAAGIKGDASKKEEYDRYIAKAWEMLERTVVNGVWGGSPRHIHEDSDLKVLHRDARWAPMAKRFDEAEDAASKD